MNGNRFELAIKLAIFQLIYGVSTTNCSAYKYYNKKLTVGFARPTLYRQHASSSHNR